ncbi:hypothetical protein diail_5259 [Diaporthe ilicicola]|nr:hypothetical protein diail_5259 [Diaporthe ilicicola]
MVSHTKSGSCSYCGIDRPRYSILSYTWGRWQVREAGRKHPPVGITGVDWDIPSIAETHFTAESFGTIVKRLGALGATDWAWIDIACIDQKDDEIKMDEVGRQVSIFRNAATPFVWLCHTKINEFYEAIELLASENWNLFRERQHTEQTGLVRQQPVLRALEGIEKAMAKFLSDPWFSSLWTLQEFILRPDAIVLDRYGESLNVLREDLALLVKSRDRQDDLLTLEALCWALHNAQYEGRQLQQRRHLLQDKGDAAGPHILELISRIFRAIQECGCGTNWLQGPSNPNIQYSAAKFRRTTHREDRIYAISQIYNVRVGQSARPMDRPSLEDLIEEFGLAINERSPVLGQLFVHTKRPEVGKSWCITEHSDVPEIGDVPARIRLTSTIARDESGFVVAHGPSCTFEDLCDFWKITPDYLETNQIYLDEHIRQLVDPANVMSPSDTERYMSRLLAHFRQGVRILLLGDYGQRFRTTSEMIYGYGLLLEQTFPGEAPRDSISYRRLGICSWTVRWLDDNNVPSDGGSANLDNISHFGDIKSRNGIPLRPLRHLRSKHDSDVDLLFSDATRMRLV